MESLGHLRAKGNVRKGGDGRYYVSVRYCAESRDHEPPFYDEDSQDAIEAWLKNNCEDAAEVFGGYTLVFTCEGDAILFLLRLRR